MQPDDPTDLKSYNKESLKVSLQATTEASLIFFTVPNANRVGGLMPWGSNCQTTC